MIGFYPANAPHHSGTYPSGKVRRDLRTPLGCSLRNKIMKEIQNEILA